MLGIKFLTQLCLSKVVDMHRLKSHGGSHTAPLATPLDLKASISIVPKKTKLILFV